MSEGDAAREALRVRARERLLAMRERLLAEALPPLDSDTEVRDLGDEADRLITEELGRVLGAARLARLEAIHGALVRAANGTYGECESCGEAIPPRRLEVMPTAIHCVECQEEIEREQGRDPARFGRGGMLDFEG